MARVKGGPQGHLRHKKVLKITKGQRGAKHRLFKRANEAMLKSMWYATRDRRIRKRDMRKLWIARINAAARLNGTTYSKLVAALKKANVLLNRKMLSDMAIRDPQTFAAVVAKTK
jgi:large subunit ribosomal protein L20